MSNQIARVSYRGFGLDAESYRSSESKTYNLKNLHLVLRLFGFGDSKRRVLTIVYMFLEPLVLDTEHSERCNIE